MYKRKYLKLGDLEIYCLAIELSDLAWKIYKDMDWQNRKVIGDQFIKAIDSIGANIAEGYGRYHYADKVKFFYNSRGSLFESKHWSFLLVRRKLIKKEDYVELLSKLDKLHQKLNSYIKSYYKKD